MNEPPARCSSHAALGSRVRRRSQSLTGSNAAMKTSSAVTCVSGAAPCSIPWRATLTVRKKIGRRRSVLLRGSQRDRVTTGRGCKNGEPGRALEVGRLLDALAERVPFSRMVRCRRSSEPQGRDLLPACWRSRSAGCKEGQEKGNVTTGCDWTQSRSAKTLKDLWNFR